MISQRSEARAIRECFRQRGTYRKAVEVNPNFSLPHCNLADALLRNRDPDGAIRACRAALQIDPNFSPAISSLRRALQLREERRDAVGPLPREVGEKK